MKKFLRFFAIGLILQQSSLSATFEAPVNIAIKNWEGFAASALHTTGCSIALGCIPEAAAALAKKLPTEGLAQVAATPAAWTLKNIASIDSSHAAGAGVALGIFTSYLFWYQITKSKQVSRAKNFFGNYLDHKVATHRYSDRKEIIASLAREQSIRKKALDEQTIVRALIEISNRINVGLDALEAAIKADPQSSDHNALNQLKEKALIALETIAYNQALFTIDHGHDYRDARRATAEELNAAAQDRVANAQASVARTAQGYLILEFGKFAWSVFKAPINIATTLAKWAA